MCSKVYSTGLEIQVMIKAVIIMIKSCFLYSLIRALPILFQYWYHFANLQGDVTKLLSEEVWSGYVGLGGYDFPDEAGGTVNVRQIASADCFI